MSLLRRNFREMETCAGDVDISYRVTVTADGRIQVRRATETLEAADSGSLVLALESDLVVQVQKRRPRLLFLHSAAVERRGMCHLLVGRSGAGKSTTCWGMLSTGYGYLSDEMAPIDVETWKVLPYPHALCLKSEPPAHYPLPRETMCTTRGYHVPASSMAAVHHDGALPIGCLLFVEYDSGLGGTECSELTPAEAATRLYPNVLNALCHKNAGLEAVASLAAAGHSWRLRFRSLPDALKRIDMLVASSKL